MVPGFFLVIGTISYVLCRRFSRRARAADAMCASDDERR
jgi:hypothetical protein